MPDIPPGSHDPDGDGVGLRGVNGRKNGASQRRDGGDTSPGRGGRSGEGGGNGGASGGKRTPGGSGGRPFISYLGTHPNEEGSDPDDLDQATRMSIENLAIDKIIALEPTLRRTPDGNPGYDLYEVNAAGAETRWVEVKSMTGTLADRPVGLSRTQFECARERGQAYWVYVVEYAMDAAKARVLRIQDPVAHARTFTFDRGWVAIAQMGPPNRV